MRRKISTARKTKAGSLQVYMQSSLSFEIIYTVLNGVVQQLQNSDKSLMVRKKANEIKKLKKMVNDTREQGSF
jgi:hypothetical protein